MGATALLVACGGGSGDGLKAPDAEALAAPAGLVALSDVDAVRLSWSETKGAASYAVQRCQIPVGVTQNLCADAPAAACGTIVAQTQSPTLREVPPAAAPVAYCYRVRACVDAAGQVCGPLSAPKPAALRKALDVPALGLTLPDDGRDIVAGQRTSLHAVPNGTAQGTASFSWTQVRGPTVAMQGANTDTLSFVSPNVTSATTLGFRVAVVDGRGPGSTREMTVTVQPVANIIVKVGTLDRQALPGHTVSLHARGSQPGLQWAWRQLSPEAPVVKLKDADTANPTFVAPKVSDVVYRFAVTGTDPVTGRQATAKTSVNIGSAVPNQITGQPLGVQLQQPTGLTAPQALRLVAGPEGSVVGGQETSIGMAVTGGLPPYTWSWTQTSGTPATLTASNSSVLTLRSPVVAFAQVLGFTATVVDAAGARQTAAASVHVTQVPQQSPNAVPPTPTVLTPRQVNVGTPVQISTTLSNPVFTQGSGPVLGLVQSGGTLSITAPSIVDQSASASVTITGTDASGRVSQQIQPVLIVRPPQQLPPAQVPPLVPTATPYLAPLLNAPLVAVGASPRDVLEGQAQVPLMVAASGGTGTYSYAWTQMAGPVVNLRNAASRTPDFDAPQVASRTELRFSVTVSSGNQTATATEQIFVNDAPTLTPLALQPPPDATVLARGETVIAMAAAGGRPPYQWAWTQRSGPAATLTQGDTARLRVQVPDVASEQVLSFQADVTDADGRQQRASAVIRVLPAATPLPALSAVPSSDATVFSGQTGVQLAVAAAGGSGTYTYAWTRTGGPAVTLRNAATGAPDFDAPSVTTPVLLSFDVVVSSGGQSLTRTVRVTVNPLPTQTPLLLQPGPDLSLVTPATGTLSLAASGGRQPYRWSWRQVSGPLATLTQADTATPLAQVPSLPSTQSLVFEATVTDADGAVRTATTRVLAQPPAAVLPALSVTPQSDQLVDSGQTGVGLAVFASGGTGQYSYAWTQTSGPAVTLRGSTGRVPNFDAPTVGFATDLQFQVAVTSQGQTQTAAVRVTVRPAVRPPLVLTAPPAVTALGGTSVPLAIAVAGGRAPYTYSWRQTNGPAAALDTPTAAQVAARLPTLNRNETYAFQATVTDADGQTAAASVQIQATLPPVAAGATPVPTKNVVGAPINLLSGRSVLFSTALQSAVVTATGSPLLLEVTDRGAAGASVRITAQPIATDSSSSTVYVEGRDAAGNSVREIRPVIIQRPLLEPPVAAQPPVPVANPYLAPSLTPTLVLPGAASFSLDEGQRAQSLVVVPIGGRGVFTYRWTYLKAVDGPDISLGTLDSQKVTFDVPLVSAPIDLSFKVTVTDGVQTAEKTYVVHVTKRAAPLAVGSLPALTVASGNAVTLSHPSPTGGAAPYQFSVQQAAGQTVSLTALGGANAGNYVFTAPTLVAGAADVVLDFTFAVTDVLGNRVPTTQRVTVTAPPAVALPNAPGALGVAISYPLQVAYLVKPADMSVTLSANVVGGTAPYTYAWTLNSQLAYQGLLFEPSDKQVQTASGPNPRFSLVRQVRPPNVVQPGSEHYHCVDVTLTVTDANGQTTTDFAVIGVGMDCTPQRGAGFGKQVLVCGDIDAQMPCSDMEVVLAVQTQCPDSAGFAASTYVFQGTESAPEEVQRFSKCTDEATAFSQWWQGSRLDPICKAWSQDPTQLPTQGVTCTYVCYGDKCNIETPVAWSNTWAIFESTRGRFLRAGPRPY